MRKTLLLAIALGFGAYAHGQRGLQLVKKTMPPSMLAHLQKIQHFVTAQNGGINQQKPTQIKQRVIAQVYDGDGEIDSTTFRYSGYHGSSYNHNSVEDFIYRDYLEDYFYFNNGINISGRATDMQADTINNYYSYAGTGINEQYIGHYRNDNQMDTMYHNSFNSGVLSNSDKYGRIYNSQGFLTDVYGMVNTSITGLQYDTVAYQKIAYNNDFSKVLSDTFWNTYPSSGQLALSTLNKYNYTTTNQLSEINSFYFDSFSGSFLPDENTIIHYTADGRISSVSIYDADLPQAYGLEYRDSFVYTPGIAYFTEWHEEEWDSGILDFEIKMIKFPGANGLPDSLIAYVNEDGMSPFTEAGRLHYFYNSFNNPERIEVTSEDGPSTTRFYYEQFDDPTSVDKVVADDNNIAIAPNPFTHSININWKQKTIPDATLKLYDMNGRIVFEKEMKMTTGANAVSVPELPGGLYLLQLQDHKGRQWSAKIVRQ